MDEKPQENQENDKQEYRDKILNPRIKEKQEAAEKVLKEKTSGREKENLREDVAYKFKEGIRQRYENAIKDESRNEREKLRPTRKELLDKAEAEAKTYLDQIKAVVYNLTTKKGKNELDEKDLYELLKIGEAMPKTFRMSEKYQKLLEAAANSDPEKGLDNEQLDQIADLVRPQRLNADIENILCAPVGAMISMLNPAQRFEVAKRVTDKQKGTIKEWTNILASTGLLTIAQTEAVWNYARKKGYVSGEFDSVKSRELKKDMEEKVKKRIKWATTDDMNWVLKNVTLGNIGAFALATWGALTFALNAAIALKSENKEGLKTYGMLGLAAFAGGTKIMTDKWPLEDKLKEKSAEDKQKIAVENAENEMMKIMGENPRLAKYLKNGGYVSIRKALDDNKGKNFTYEDLEKIESDPKQKKLLIELKKYWPNALKSMNDISGLGSQLQDLEKNQAEAAKKDIKTMAEVPALLRWQFDPKSPAESQIRFANFYDKYAKKYNLA